MPQKDKINFDQAFSRLKPIVLKAMKQLRVRSWTYDDYLQEGMIVLYHLLESSVGFEGLPVKFKVQYHQRLIDEIRHSQAKKRGFDQLGAVDIYEYSDVISSHGETPESALVFNHLLAEVYECLRPHYQELLVRQMRGEELTRMERYRLKEKIKSILFDLDDSEE
ncbi:sigma-70 family RNA polymerase sigma factor [Lactococcus protaetiae]|uniref:Sigma-70 family RNA polymerase sigma factor n=1 Tax=Lactococcus protaetiae TaxID=2592653 RepID=A0A514Z695_9LACT|nr:sigma-70 family RNA polymerase sigma factor [Lactococcus protaetiae]MCL2114239.1 sigma-70 family RNA polymerase sigma factor [Streptococcaceae bacterium]QDK70073.1 sigma-70 family RNA polymerase sigma factor [Lactococcus protaetiae]